MCAPSGDESGEAFVFVDLVGLDKKIGADRACPARFPCYHLSYDHKRGKWCGFGFSKPQNCPSPAAITRARLAFACYACTRELLNLVPYPNTNAKYMYFDTVGGDDIQRFKYFLYVLEEFYLVLHYVPRLREAPIGEK
jgi:hypothetical protein